MDSPRTGAFQGSGKPLLYTRVNCKDFEFIVMSVGGIWAGQP